MITARWESLGSTMKTLLKLEELAQFVLCLTLLAMNDVPWWAYLLLAIGPDIGMLGYMANPRIGAFSYNVLHHKGVALLVALTGFVLIPFAMTDVAESIARGWLAAAIVLYGHASMDRIFGYGLKFGDNFHHTHLGWIGKLKRKEQ